MKTNLLIMLVAILVTLPTINFAQDLIQRTQVALSPSQTNTSEPNELAKLVQATKNNSRTSAGIIDLFEVGEQNANRFNSFASEAVILTIKEQVLKEFWKTRAATTLLKIPVNDSSYFELDLVQVEVHTADFSSITSSGTITNFSQQGVFYRGIVKEDNNSMAIVSVFENNIQLLLGDNEGNYTLGKLPDTKEYVLYNDQNLLSTNSFTCGTNEAYQINRERNINPSNTPNTSRNSKANCIPVYIECDYQTYLDFGQNEAQINEFAANLMNQTAAFYANENIEVALSQVKIWKEVDPYSSLNSTGDVLEKFGELTKNNYNGRLAHWVSTRRLGGGVAWLNVLCEEYYTFPTGEGETEVHHAGPYAVSSGMGTTVTPFPNYSFDLSVFVHEMGHNLGSPHTQACAWNNNNTALDGCVDSERYNGQTCPRPEPNCPAEKGTIMSYCDLSDCGIPFANGFGQQPGDLIRDRYNNASCILSCVPPTCTDQVQNGDETGVDCGGTNCPSCPCFESPLSLSITFDDYPEEVSWTIKNATGTTLHHGESYGSQADGATLVINNLELADGDGYLFTISDEAGDGICCHYGEGQFILTDNAGTVVLAGGEYGNEASKIFCSSAGACPPRQTINTHLSAGTHRAANTIVTSGTVEITGNVIFKAGQSITLNNGFHAKAASNFQAIIEGCQSSLSLPSTNVIAKIEASTTPEQQATKLQLRIQPNPLQHTSTIEYYLPSNQDFSLELVDLAGQSIQTIAPLQNKSAGLHQLSFNASQLKGGLYVLYLITSEEVLSKKVIVIR